MSDQAKDHFVQETRALAQAAENLRLHHMRRYRFRTQMASSLMVILVSACAIGFGWFLMMQGDVLRALSCVVLAGVMPPLFLYWATGPLKAYKRAHKQKFLPHLAKLLGGLSYHPHRGVNHLIVQKSGIAPRFSRYKTEDCFFGTLRSVKVIFSEARLYNKSAHHPAFRGLVVLLESPTDSRFEGSVIITNDRDFLPPLPAQNFAFESPHTPEFRIYADTLQTSASVASARLLKELSEAGAIFGKAPIRASFFAKRFILLMIPCADDMFEASDLFFPVRTVQFGERLRGEIARLMEIIDIFALYSTPKP